MAFTDLSTEDLLRKIKEEGIDVSEAEAQRFRDNDVDGVNNINYFRTCASRRMAAKYFFSIFQVPKVLCEDLFSIEAHVKVLHSHYQKLQPDT
ncbi:hypothetical protein AMECASPLE_032550 [Ameca splendens]|uniref:Uncharacterized protein n=1 Tax=Ameca splendens TaxID=208324 RepID=A0ABV1AFM1_9TELE